MQQMQKFKQDFTLHHKSSMHPPNRISATRGIYRYNVQ